MNNPKLCMSDDHVTGGLAPSATSLSITGAYVRRVGLSDE